MPRLPITMPLTKTCSCGIQHAAVPTEARYDHALEMYYWECTCKSTMSFTPDKVRTLALIRLLREER